MSPVVAVAARLYKLVESAGLRPQDERDQLVADAVLIESFFYDDVDAQQQKHLEWARNHVVRAHGMLREQGSLSRTLVRLYGRDECWAFQLRCVRLHLVRAGDLLMLVYDGWDKDRRARAAVSAN